MGGDIDISLVDIWQKGYDSGREATLKAVGELLDKQQKTYRYYLVGQADNCAYTPQPFIESLLCGEMPK